MDSQYTIAVGMSPNELCPPYSRGIRKSERERFYELLESREKVLKFGTASEARYPIVSLKSQRVGSLEVVGAWGNLCVASTVVYALRLGFNVSSPDEMVIFYYKDKRDLPSAVEKLAKQQYNYSFDSGTHFFEPKESELEESLNCYY